MDYMAVDIVSIPQSVVYCRLFQWKHFIFLSWLCTILFWLVYVCALQRTET